MKQLLRDSSNYDESHNPSLPDKNKPWCLNCRRIMQCLGQSNDYGED
jgi:hypothetical protein